MKFIIGFGICLNIISPLDLEWILQSAYEKKKKKERKKEGVVVG